MKMKRIFLVAIFFIALTTCVIAQNREMMRPESLRPGDKIAIISPAGKCPASFVSSAEQVLREWGYVPVVGKYALEVNGSFAGTIEQRKHDLEAALLDPEIKAILCTRGGYGSMQELCEMDLDIFARNPKWIIGYSDITAIHSTAVTKGVMSIHGQMCAHLKKYHGKDSCSRALRNILAGGVPHYKVKADRRNNYGTAKGMLLGGNLAMLNSFTASPIDMLANYADRDVILFIEDVGESLERLNRMIYTLKLNGTLGRIKGFIVGDFKNVKYTPDFKHVYDMIESVMKDYDIPVAYGFPVGHVDENYPMIEGAEVTLVVNDDGSELTFDM